MPTGRWLPKPRCALLADQPGAAPAKVAARIDREAAWRELGLITQARDELFRLVPELDQAPAMDYAANGRARYHLSLCQWRLGDRASAQRSAEASLAAYDDSPKANPVVPALRRQSEELLAAVKAGEAPPPLAKIDAPAALEAARAAFEPALRWPSYPLTRRRPRCSIRSLAGPGPRRRCSTHSTATIASRGNRRSGSCSSISRSGRTLTSCWERCRGRGRLGRSESVPDTFSRAQKFHFGSQLGWWAAFM